MSRCRFIEAQRAHYPVRLLCQLVKVPGSGCYAWQQTQHQKVDQAEPAWETALVKAFGVHKRCYGTRRLRVELRRTAEGFDALISGAGDDCLVEAPAGLVLTHQSRDDDLVRASFSPSFQNRV